MSRRILVVANDHVGRRMAGPGIRSLRIAAALADENDVTLVVPFPTDVLDAGLTIVQDDPWDARRMNSLVRTFDAVIAQKLPVPTMRQLARSDIAAIYDLYAPVTLEALAFTAGHRGSPRIEALHRLNTLTQEAVLAYGDAFICASEQQRDLWLGGLLALGRIDQARYDTDPSLRNFVAVVPFGIDTEPATRPSPVMKGVVPGIGHEDKVLLWGGGVWNWLDPLTVIRAVARLSRRRPELRLFFLGLTHPNPAVPRMEMQDRAVELARELGATGESVFFNEGWVEHSARGAYLKEADLGVSAHFDDLETRFAFRTRLLDCFWAGLPVVATRGDALAEVVATRGLGRTVPVGDVEAWVEAIDGLLADESELHRVRERLALVREDYSWSKVVEPLRVLLQQPRSASTAGGVGLTARYVRARSVNAIQQHGSRRAAGAALRSLLGRTQPLAERVRVPRL